MYLEGYIVEVLQSLKTLLLTIVSVLGQKEVIGIVIGAFGTILWYWVTNKMEQSDKDKMVLLQIEGNIRKNIEIANHNTGVVENELSKLPQTFTLEPLQEFFCSSGDLLVITSSLKCGHSLELWNSLKRSETLNRRVSFLVNETFTLRRMIKAETRTEICAFELIPYLIQFNQMLLKDLSEIKNENERALTLIDKLKS